MAEDKEAGLRVDDFMGINRAVSSEDGLDYYWRTIQNLWERKLGELQRRGGASLLTSTTIPSNIVSIDNTWTLKDKILGKTNIAKVKIQRRTSALSITGLSASFQTDVSGTWGTGSVGITGAYIGCVSNGGSEPAIMIVATGFGIRHQVASVTTSLPVSGDTKILQIVMTTPVSDNNITGLDVYANVIMSYVGGTAQYRYVYVGHVDLHDTPSGTFTFTHGPVTLGADPGAPQVIGDTPATFTAVSAAVGGGSFTPGKTYYVAVMSQYLNYQATAAASRCLYRTTTVLPVTIEEGHDSITVSKTGAGSAANIVAFGLHPQLLQPNFRLTPVTATWSTTYSSPSTGNQIGVIMPTHTSSTVTEYIYKVADSGFGHASYGNTADAFAKVVSDKWRILPINNALRLNDNSSDYGLPDSDGNVFVSNGARYSAEQYFSDTQDLLFMVPRNNWVLNAIADSASFTYGAQPDDGDVITVNGRYYEFESSGGVTAGNISVTIGGAEDTTYTSFVAAVNANDPTVIATIVTGTNTVTLTQRDKKDALDFFDGGRTGTLAGITITAKDTYVHHNLMICDGNAVAMAVMDFGSSQPPRSSYIKAFKESLVLGGGKLEGYNRIYFTPPITPFSFGVPGASALLQYIQVESGGEEVNGLGRYSNTSGESGPLDQFLVCKPNSIFLLTDLPTYSISTANSSTITQLSKKVGCANHDTIVNTDIGTIITSQSGVWLIRETGEPTPIGTEIADLLRPEDPSQSVDSTYWHAVFHHNHYKLVYSTGGSSIPNQEVWLNIRKMKQMKGQPCWFGPHVGREIRHSFVEEQFLDTILEKRICVDATNLRWYSADREDVTQDFSTSIACVLESRDNPCGDPNINKLHTRTIWRMKVDAAFDFTETTTTLNSGGESAEAIVRSLAPITGYSGGTYALFTTARAKNYEFFPSGRPRGETIRKKFAYTGTVFFAISALSIFFSPERRRSA